MKKICSPATNSITTLYSISLEIRKIKFKAIHTMDNTNPFYNKIFKIWTFNPPRKRFLKNLKDNWLKSGDKQSLSTINGVLFINELNSGLPTKGSSPLCTGFLYHHSRAISSPRQILFTISTRSAMIALLPLLKPLHGKYSLQNTQKIKSVWHQIKCIHWDVEIKTTQIRYSKSNKYVLEQIMTSVPSNVLPYL